MDIKLLRCKNCFPTRQDHWKNCICTSSKSSQHQQIWKLRKCIYGLADASWYWYLKFREELIKLGARPSQLDQGELIWSINSKPVGIMVCFVDVLWGGNSNFIYIINKLKQTFHTDAEHSQTFNYIGIQIKWWFLNHHQSDWLHKQY